MILADVQQMFTNGGRPPSHTAVTSSSQRARRCVTVHKVVGVTGIAPARPKTPVPKTGVSALSPHPHVNGSHGGIRTPDLRLIKTLLWLLSYVAMKWSTWWDSHPRPSPWQGDTLATELHVHEIGGVSNSQLATSRPNGRAFGDQQ